MIGISILLVIIIITIVLVIILKPKIYNEIICRYETKNDTEYISLINIKNNIKFKIKIDNIWFENKNNYTLEKAGIHEIIFEFRNKLDSLEGIFEGNKKFNRS